MSIKKDRFDISHVLDHPKIGPVDFERATMESQIEHKTGSVPDSPDTEKARKNAVLWPGDYSARVLYGKALAMQFRFREASEEYAEAIAIEPTRFEARLLRAAALTDSLRLKEAKEELKTAAHFAGMTDDILYRLGIVAYFSRDFAEAGQLFRKAVDTSSPEDMISVASIDWCWMSARRSGNDALAKEAIGLFPGFEGRPSAYELRCAVYSGKMSLEDGIQYSKSLTSVVPIITTSYGLSLFCLVNGKPETAAKLRKRVLEQRTYWTAYGYIAAYLDEAELTCDSREQSC